MNEYAVNMLEIFVCEFKIVFMILYILYKINVIDGQLM